MPGGHEKNARRVKRRGTADMRERERGVVERRRRGGS